MIVSYRISLPEPLMFPSAASLRIEIRDTSLIDAPSVTLAATLHHADQLANSRLITGAVELPGQITPKATITLWAHLSLNGEARVSKEDFITTRAYPITNIDEHGQVVVVMQPVDSSARAT
jgi:uncharacterized lipoprotein YbaY